MERKTIAAWVTHSPSGEVFWERFSDGNVEISLYMKNSLGKCWQSTISLSSFAWEDVVQVFTIKDHVINGSKA